MGALPMLSCCIEYTKMYLKESCKGVDLGKNGVSLGHQGLTQEGFSLDRSFIGTQRKVNEVQVVTRRQEKRFWRVQSTCRAVGACLANDYIAMFDNSFWSLSHSLLFPYPLKTSPLMTIL